MFLYACDIKLIKLEYVNYFHYLCSSRILNLKHKVMIVINEIILIIIFGVVIGMFGLFNTNEIIKEKTKKRNYK